MRNILFSYWGCEEYKLSQPSGNASCACLGDVLIYTCTAVGGGNTQWGGTAFNCPDISDKILLSHTLYGTQEGTHESCNNGDITARSLGVVESCYISQLNITVRKASSTVQCTHNSNSGPIPISESLVTTVSSPFPPPNNLRITDIQPGPMITFAWDPVAPNCLTVQYNITSDCGVCPVTTNSTSIMCSNQQIPSTCILRVQSMICGFIGSSTGPVFQILKLPNVPNVDIIPHYSNNSQTLIRVTILKRNSTDDLLSVSQYNISSNLLNKNLETERSSCMDGVCKFVANFSLLLNQCLPISVNISAINVLGAGQPLQHTITGCNSFVKVKYDNQKAVFSCIFNKMDTTTKSCVISYGQCGNLLYNVSNKTSATESTDMVLLKLTPEPPINQVSCYSINATLNGTETVIVEGQIDRDVNSDDSQGHNKITIAVSVTVFAVALLAIIIGVPVACLILIRKIMNSSNREKSNKDLRSMNQYTVESHAERGKSKPEVKPHMISQSSENLQSKNQYTVESHAERGKSKPDEVKPHTFS